MSAPADTKPLIQMIDAAEYKKLAATMEAATVADILDALNHAQGKNLLSAFAAYAIAYGAVTADKDEKLLVGKKPESEFSEASSNTNWEVFTAAVKKGLKYCGYSRDQLEFTRDSLMAAAKHGKFENAGAVANVYEDILLIMAALKRLETTTSGGAAKFASTAGAATISLVVMEAWRTHGQQK
ncbi:MAG: hypothetical protein EYC62_04485 [Alphaproteobacteria bacterium]|nr:MAG: hypothetical protein EYC62_04485 [Alphaproteobacteria bacterium]